MFWSGATSNDRGFLEGRRTRSYLPLSTMRRISINSARIVSKSSTFIAASINTRRWRRVSAGAIATGEGACCGKTGV